MQPATNGAEREAFPSNLKLAILQLGCGAAEDWFSSDGRSWGPVKGEEAHIDARAPRQ